MTKNYQDIQREQELLNMGHESRKLYMEGYCDDADKILDQINEKRRKWGLPVGGPEPVSS
jgi:hypothetical protein